MATYYVDYTNSEGTSADTNNGTSTSTAFIHCPGDDNATDTAGFTTLVANDTVVFKGGITYLGRIDCDWSGSDSNPITYISGEDAPYSWGTGQAVIDGTGITVAAGQGTMNIGAATYITLDGLAFTNSPNIAYTGSIAVNLGEHITVDGCLIDLNGQNGFFMYGVWATGSRSDAIIIQNCNIKRNVGHGILLLRGISNVQILNNSIYDNGYPGGAGASDGIFMGGGAQGENTLHTVTIRGNTVFDNIGKGPLIMAGIDVLIEDNHFYSTLQEQIGISIASQSTEDKTSNIIIRNNVLDLDVYFNHSVIRINEGWGGIGIDGVTIYNNYIKNSGNYYLIYIEETTAVDNITIKNNVMDLSASGSNIAIYIADDGPLANLDSDYNHYWESGGSDDQIRFYYGSTGNYTLTQWKAVGQDDFVHTHWTDPDVDANFKPNISSPLIDEGVDLSGTGFSDDKDGISRPQGIAWDIGAYERILTIFNQSIILEF